MVGWENLIWAVKIHQKQTSCLGTKLKLLFTTLYCDKHDCCERAQRGTWRTCCPSLCLSVCLSFGPWWEPIKGSFQLELSSAILRSYDDDDDDLDHNDAHAVAVAMPPRGAATPLTETGWWWCGPYWWCRPPADGGASHRGGRRDSCCGELTWVHDMNDKDVITW